ncbi:GntR family transcriptional regulator [Sediminicoccus sp. KRV36]|uniref:GntR family transcriptional regulator n=1 Tax=Sediminicoccus sp. KRV36 TaxID=3133721 RepID=UPI00200FD91F|nr:GntR family transcriptional regulator [Sediminicoccus rosea]UPY36511.1 GntR family transcriptional regulator [Sediminicoccus rosea]
MSATKLPPEAPRASAVDIAYEALRGMLLLYELRPAERLNEVHLAERLGLSRTPLREALNRLAAERLLVARGGQGFFVRDLDLREAMDLYELREALEATAFRLACERATPAAVNALARAWRARHRQLAREQDRAAMVAEDVRFHESLCALSANAELLRTLSEVNARTTFIRWAYATGPRPELNFDEHDALLEALTSRDAASGAAILHRHIGRRAEALATLLAPARAFPIIPRRRNP